jgi:hypothetical protein
MDEGVKISKELLPLQFCLLLFSDFSPDKMAQMATSEVIRIKSNPHITGNLSPKRD